MIGLIFRKEMREALRDKRFISGALLGPVILMVFFVWTFSLVENSLTSPRAVRVHILMPENSNLFLEKLVFDPMVQVEYVDSATQGEELVRKGDARLFLRFPDDLDALTAVGEPGEIVALYDPDEVLSILALRVITEAARRHNEETREQVLAMAGIDPASLEPLTVVEDPVEKEAMGGSSTLVGLLPYLIVIWAFYGGFSVVSDLVAGEKERQTMETLLISPVRRSQIAFGKFFALSVVCLVSSLMSLLTVVALGLVGGSMGETLFPGGFVLTGGALFSIMLVLLPLVALFSGVMLAVSAFAKNVREAQTYLTLVSFLVLLPAVASQFIGFMDVGRERWVSWVPVLNSSTAIRSALLGRVDLAHLGITVGTSLVLAAIGIAVAVWLFEREQIVSRT